MMRPGLRPLLLAVLLGAGSALAQVPDPTRPPGLVLTPEAVAAGAAPLESGVQMVILRHGGRKSAAVINGQYVEVGDRLGDKRVLKISESEIVLQGASGREVIKMTPAIEKMPVRKTAAIKRRTTGNTE